jgi:hypothetical protein
MKILFYIEPFPIRNSQIHYADIARKAFLIIREQNKLSVSDRPSRIYVYANQKTLDVLKGEIGGIEKNIVYPTDEETKITENFLIPWEFGGIQKWTSLLKGEGDSEIFENILNSIYRRCPFDVIVYWGENGAINRFCRARGIGKVALELGCIRSPYMDSIVFDPIGVNGNSCVSRLNIDQIGDIVGKQKFNKFEHLMSYSETLEAVPYQQYYGSFSFKDQDRVLNYKGRGVVYLPLQLYDDANLLQFSKYESLVDVVDSIVPRIADAGYLTIIKPHPLAKLRPNAHLHNEEARRSLRRFHDSVVWLDDATDVPNPRIFSLVDRVITVNSSVGFEALIHDCVVSPLGDAVYKPAGVFPSLSETLDPGLDRSAYLDRIRLLRQFMLGGYLVSARDAFRPDVFLDRVLGIVAAVAQFGEDPVQLANFYYHGLGLAGRTRRQLSLVRGIGPATTELIPIRARQNSDSLEEDDFVPTGVPGVKVELFNKIVRWVTDLGVATGAYDFADKVASAHYDEEIYGEVLEGSGLFDRQFYLEQYPDVLESEFRDRPVLHYILYGEQEKRLPSRIFTPKIYSRENSEEPAAVDRPALAAIQAVMKASEVRMSAVRNSGATEEEEADAVQVARQRLIGLTGRTSARIAVVCHIFYSDMTEDLMERLGQIPEPFDLFVSTPIWGRETIERTVRHAYPEAVIFAWPNRGRDVSPFIEILPQLINSNYAAVLKIHSKKGFFLGGKFNPDMGMAWHQMSLDSLLPGPKEVIRILSTIKDHESIKMVGPSALLLSSEAAPTEDRKNVFHRLRLMDRDAGGDFCFFAGTMFWAKPEILRPIADLGLDLWDFESEDGANVNQLAHTLERAFGFAVRVSGGKIATLEIKKTSVASSDQILNINQNPLPSSESIVTTLKNYLDSKS